MISNFISDVSVNVLLEELVRSTINGNKYDVKDIYFVFKEKLIDALIGLGIKKGMDLKDPFREFLVRRQIAGLLMQFKETATATLKDRCLEAKDNISSSLIELIGYLESDEMTDSLLQLTHHKDPAIRTAVIQALSEIGSTKAVEGLSKIAAEEHDSNIRDLANTRLQKLKKKIR